MHIWLASCFSTCCPDYLEIVRRHPPLAVELARRFTDAPLPDSADVTTEMTHANMSVSTDEGYVPAVTVAVYGTPRPGRADRAGALALTILNAKGTCGSGTAGAASM